MVELHRRNIRLGNRQENGTSDAEMAEVREVQLPSARNQRPFLPAARLLLFHEGLLHLH